MIAGHIHLRYCAYTEAYSLVTLSYSSNFWVLSCTLRLGFNLPYLRILPNFSVRGFVPLNFRCLKCRFFFNLA